MCSTKLSSGILNLPIIVSETFRKKYQNLTMIYRNFHFCGKGQFSPVLEMKEKRENK